MVKEDIDTISEVLTDELEEKQSSKPKDRRILTIFFFMLFSLLIAMTRYIDTTLIALAFAIILIFAQMVFLKNMLDDFYGD